MTTIYIVGFGVGAFTPKSTATCTVECWGAGGAGTSTGIGGASAGYSKKNAFALTINTPVPFSLGAPGAASGVAGGDTWFSTISSVLAPGGGSGTTAIGDVTFAGAAGAAQGAGTGASGGSGASGPQGIGKAGGQCASGSSGGGGGGDGGGTVGGAPSGGTGGTGGNGFVGTGGASTAGGGQGAGGGGSPSGSSAGAGGDDYDNGGGGGGGGGTSVAHGGTGGTPGGGSGGCESSGTITSGGYSVIKITYASATDHSQIYVVASATTTFSIQIPSTWGTTALAEVWGGGGNGGNGSASGSGGSGASGGYAAKNALAITPGFANPGSATVRVAGPHASTSFVTGATTVNAASGGSGGNGPSGTAGAVGAAGTGDVVNAGAAGQAGGAATFNAGGGAASATAAGAGVQGSAASASSTGAAGGNANTGGAGGTGTVGSGNPGVSDGRGGGGGAGGGIATTALGGAGGWPGGGGGGGGTGTTVTGGAGAPGLAILTGPAGTQWQGSVSDNGIGSLASGVLSFSPGFSAFSGSGVLKPLGTLSGITSAPFAGVGSLAVNAIHLKAAAVALSGVGSLAVTYNLALAGLAGFTGSGDAGSLIPTSFNPAFLDATATLSNNNFTVTDTSTVGCTSTRSISSEGIGQFFCSLLINTSDPNSGVGICSGIQPLNQSLANSNTAIDYLPNGNVTFGVGSFGPDFGLSFSSNIISVLASYTTGGTVDIAVDFSNQSLWFRVNGGNWNNNVSANPATNTGGISISTFLTTTNGPYYVAVECRNSAQVTANFGSTAYPFAAPAGFQNWASLGGTLVELELAAYANWAGVGNVSLATTLFEAGLAMLPGAGNLNGTIFLDAKASALFTGVGSLAVNATRIQAVNIWQGSSLFTGAGNLSVNALQYLIDTAELLAGAGQLNASDNLVEALIVQWAGAGGLSSSALTFPFDFAELFAGAGSLTASTMANDAALAVLAGAGSLTATAVKVDTLESYIGLGSLNASASLAEVVTALFTGTGNLSGDARPQSISIVLVGSGSLSASVIKVDLAELLPGSSNLSTVLAMLEVATVVLAGAGNLSSVAILQEAATTLFAGAGSASALVTDITTDSAELFAGAGSMNASARDTSQTVVWQGSVLFAGAGSLSASTMADDVAFVNLTGAGNLSAFASRYANDTAELFAGTGSLIPTIFDITTDSAELFAGAGNLSVNATKPYLLSVQFPGAGVQNVSATLQEAVNALLAGSGSVNAADILAEAANILLAGTGNANLTITNQIYAAVALLNGTGSLSPFIGGSVWQGASALVGAGTLTGQDILMEAIASMLAGSGSSVESTKAFLALIAALNGAGNASFSYSTGGMQAAIITLPGLGNLIVTVNANAQLTSILNELSGESAAAVIIHLLMTGTGPIQMYGMGSLAVDVTPLVPFFPRLYNTGISVAVPEYHE